MIAFLPSSNTDPPLSPPTGLTDRRLETNRQLWPLAVVVAVVLGDSGVVTLALPEILRDFGASVGDVAWVLIAFNLVLALVSVPAARLCVRGDPAVATLAGLFVFAAATTVCALAP